MALQREQVVQTAEKYVSRGKIEPAIREYRKLLAENPSDINTLNRVGDLYAKIQRIEEAVDFFSQIGEQYSSQGFFVKAIAIYKKIIKLDPTRLDIYEQLADLYHKQNLVTEARTQYQVLADYYTKHENAASAIAIYNKMTVLEPENPTYHVKLAEIYQQQKLFEKAMNEYRVIAELMIQHGRTQDASQVYERALAIDSKNLRFIWDAAEALRAAGDDASAARFLTVAVERNPEAEEVARELAARRAPQPEPEPEPEMELRVEPDEPAALVVQDDASVELEIDLGDDLMAAMKAAEASVADSDEIEIDLDPLGEMVVELPTEEESASQVKPPPDLAGAPVRPAWARQEPVEEPPALEFELDLGDSLTLEPLEVEGLAAEPAPSAPSAYSAPAGESFAEADAFVLEPLEAEVELEALPAWEAEEAVAAGPSREEIERDELITEAEVLAKYGLDEKAVERLEEALRARPDSLLAHSLLIKIHLDKGRHEKVFPLARRMAEIAVMDGVAEPWGSVRQRLEESGYRLNGDVVVAGPHMAAPAPAPVVEEPEPEAPVLDPVLEEIALDDLEELTLDEPEAIPFEEPAPPPPPPAPEPVLQAPPPEPAKPAPPRRPAAPAKGVDDLLKGILQDKPARKPGAATPPPRPPSPPPVAAPPPSPPPPAPAPAAKSGLFDLTSLGSMIEEEEAGVAPASPAFPPAAASDADALWEATKPGLAAPPPPIEDSGVNWLDEADAATAKPPAQQTGPGLFDDEEDFFDLAGELVEELSKEEVFQDGVQAEQSLEEIVEGFKKGVAEHLSPTDYDTHFNLGIAYREMGLLDEAIGEFQLAAKDARYLVVSSSMLGLCFQDKGLPELSVKWYRRGMEAPNLSEEDQLGLMYDLGNAYMAMGDMSSAFATFVELYGINTNYRDVVAKLEELRK
ncbi:MAG TPA: tetratricopeptide repeat protein [Thermoanaerobaculia bacterium]|jgi:tetratricopeptide (TPR) repeat protein|nr:tetratricopeptide repeat protein [Thermoanaerobaculia bacterium]